MKKIRGKFCCICKSHLPNEMFSGKGHGIHVCRECSNRPKTEQEEIQYTDEIFNFLNQSHISNQNISRLLTLTQSDNPKLVELAEIVLEVARVKPHKKRRLKILANEHRDLLKKLEDTGLIMAHHRE